MCLEMDKGIFVTTSVFMALIKLKNVLWSGELKASLGIAAEKLIHKMSSNSLLGCHFSCILSVQPTFPTSNLLSI